MKEDLKGLKACLAHSDYFSMLVYITIVIDKYTGKDKEFLLSISNNIKKGNYEEVKKIFKN